jgi:lipopolysaccharide/colanic/teichoic acid biosynthesis glycosyltransferase
MSDSSGSWSDGELGHVCVEMAAASRKRRVQLSLKRGLDLAGATVGLIALSPLMALIACAIKIDSSGPVLFVQERAGEDGKPFRMYKFRSMVAEAEEMLERLVDIERLPSPAFKIRDDPRVTRMGRVLRRTSLDELPQLWNVLKGEMSLVGPRPEEMRIVGMYDEYQRRRLAMKPGITGPMQVDGRGALTFEERMDLELAYIDDHSLWEDLKILVKTLPAVVRGDGSY